MGRMICVGNSIKGHTRVTMGSTRVDLAEARENGLENSFSITLPKGDIVL
jgi:hypothetical protein